MSHDQKKQASIDMVDIAIEVKKQGFYIAEFHKLVNSYSSLSRENQMKVIRKLAADVNLKVSFNHILEVCIFELIYRRS